MKALLALVVSLVPVSAAAQPGDISEGAQPAELMTPPSFTVIDTLDARSRIGLQVSYIQPNIGDSSIDAPTLLRFEAHAEYVDRLTGLGGYLQIPLAYEHASALGMSDPLTDFGDLEIGAIYVPRLGRDATVILHAGMTLPTGERGAKAQLGTAENGIALPQLYNSLPKAATLKLGVSPVFRSPRGGRVFGRIDLGLDWNLDVDRGSVGKGYHINAGLGVDLDDVALMLESENIVLTSDRENADPGSITLSAIALSARGSFGAVSPYAALVIPVEDDIQEIIDLAFTLGLDVRF